MSAIYLWFLAKTGRKLGFNIVPILGVTRDIFSVDLQVKVVRNVSSESEIFFSLWLSSKFKKMTYLLYFFCIATMLGKSSSISTRQVLKLICYRITSSVYKTIP